MTDTAQELAAWKPPEVLAPSHLESLDAFLATLDDDTTIAFVGTLQQRRKDEALIQGLALQRRREALADGDWGRFKREFTMQTGMSDRTLSRRCAEAAEFFGLELTAAQQNARAAARPTADEAYAGLGLDEGEDDDGDGEWEYPEPDGPRDLLKEMNDGAGWGDGQLPSADYVSLPDSEPRRVVVPPPDDTWLAFTAAGIAQEHDTYGEEALERLAKSRWAKMAQEDPLSLLEDLETIHEEDGVPDELAAALLERSENMPITPEVVDAPKKRRSGGAPKPRGVEGGLTHARELHADVVRLREEGGAEAVVAAYGKDVASLQSWQHTLAGILQKVRNAKDEVDRAKRRAAQETDAAAGIDPEEDF